MFCPKCGQENLDDAQLCSSCNSALLPAPSPGSVDVKTSGLAIASCLFGILSLLALPAIAPRSAVPLSLGVTAAMSAILLGTISLIQINSSAGKVAGKGFAIVGILIPVILFPLMFLTFGVPRYIGGGGFRMTCGTNLSRLGKAILMYANDYEDELPRAGGPESRWTPHILNWAADNRYDAYALALNGDAGTASISSSLYLLLKYGYATDNRGDASPKLFVCNSDSGTTEFSPAKYGLRDKELADLWDFGPNPTSHCSYTYHLPYGPYALTTSSEPGMAVAADRNPWIDSPFAKAKDFSRFKPDLPQFGGTTDQARHGNSVSHQEDGQSVLFMDAHVEFAKRSYCAIDDDNIYTHLPQGLGHPEVGRPPVPCTSQLGHRKDSFLVHDPPMHGKK